MTRVTKGRSLRTTPDEDQLSPRNSLRRWGGVAAATAVALLAVTALTAGARTDAGSQRAADRASGGRVADDPTEDAAAPPTPIHRCVWASDITSEVRPADDIGRPPLPGAVLVMELCDGVWTRGLAWLVHGATADVDRRPGDPPTASARSRPGSADALLPGSRRMPICRRR
jgi:hypothetical protein